MAAVLLISSLASCSKKEEEITTTEEIITSQQTTVEETEVLTTEPVIEIPTNPAVTETTTLPSSTPSATEAPTSEEVSSEELPQEMIDRINAIYHATSTGPQTIKTVQQMAIITSICATKQGGGRGPITVTPATLNGEEITLLTLGGTEFKKGQATTVTESKLASYGQSNDYLKAVIKLIKNHTVPANKPLFVTGISLGGMIAQQLLGEEKLLNENGIKIKGIVTFGSPLTRPIDRHGVKVVRFADEHDMVPKLGEMPLYNDVKQTGSWSKVQKNIDKSQNEERILKTSKYTNPLETHALSYIEDSCWDEYDFFGSTNKENVLVLKQGLTFYPAPKLS